ncbi:hypothetical protein DFJ73DRAFT_852729 [Zopfochytrium polystomum]|nr:hypothetical protein DFJ73DRAFT_852729 [Zopfochytrium polystomum]
MPAHTLTPMDDLTPPLIFHELVYDPDTPTSHLFAGPNGWKVHLSLLHKRVPFVIQPITLLEVSTTLRARRGGQPSTTPALELPDGTILCDSFRIAEHLEAAYPSAPSLFSGDGAVPADPRLVAAGRRFARLVDLGLGSSDPQWAVWFDAVFPQIAERIPPGPDREFIVSDSRMGPGGFRKALERPEKEDLVARAKLNVAPIAAALAERPGEFLAGPEPGFVDFVVFGRYAMVRNNAPHLVRELFEERGAALERWIGAMLERYPSIVKHLRPI